MLITLEADSQLCKMRCSGWVNGEPIKTSPFSAVPLFTTDCEENRDLHKLGIPGLTRQNIGEFIEELGAKLSDPKKERQKRIDALSPPAQDQNHSLEPPMTQMSFWEN